MRKFRTIPGSIKDFQRKKSLVKTIQDQIAEGLLNGDGLAEEYLRAHGYNVEEVIKCGLDKIAVIQRATQEKLQQRKSMVMIKLPENPVEKSVLVTLHQIDEKIKTLSAESKKQYELDLTPYNYKIGKFNAINGLTQETILKVVDILRENGYNAWYVVGDWEFISVYWGKPYVPKKINWFWRLVGFMPDDRIRLHYSEY